MRSRIRNVVAVVLGFVAASAVMMVVEMINGKILYPELGRRAAGVTDREVIRSIMASAPSGALIVVLIGWILGSAAGGFLTTWFSGKSPGLPALILAVLLTLAGVANNLMLPPPVWFWIATLVVFLPAVLAGARLTTKLGASVADSSR